MFFDSTVTLSLHADYRALPHGHSRNGSALQRPLVRSLQRRHGCDGMGGRFHRLVASCRPLFRILSDLESTPQILNSNRPSCIPLSRTSASVLVDYTSMDLLTPFAAAGSPSDPTSNHSTPQLPPPSHSFGPLRTRKRLGHLGCTDRSRLTHCGTRRRSLQGRDRDQKSWKTPRSLSQLSCRSSKVRGYLRASSSAIDPSDSSLTLPAIQNSTLSGRSHLHRETVSLPRVVLVEGEVQDLVSLAVGLSTLPQRRRLLTAPVEVEGEEDSSSSTKASARPILNSSNSSSTLRLLLRLRSTSR